jgi:hypothetical protein
MKIFSAQNPQLKDTIRSKMIREPLILRPAKSIFDRFLETPLERD